MSGRRSAPIRTPDEDFKGYTATIITYGVVDSYRTKWAPGVFTRSLGEWMPVNTWGHDWNDPIGVMDDVVYDGADRTDAHFRLDLELRPDEKPAVPRAWQAKAQLQSGTMRHVSVGFSNETARVVEHDGRQVPEFTSADLDEVGLVARGAVPGAAVTDLRSRGQRISVPELAQLARAVEAGEMTEAEALRALSLLYGSEGGGGGPKVEEGEVIETIECDPEVSAILDALA